MDYKTVATILTDINGPREGLDAAIALTSRMGQHLDIYVTTVTHAETTNYYIGATAVMIAEHANDAITRRKALQDWVKTRMKGEVIPWTIHEATLSGEGLQSYLARKLRFCDLVVLPRPYQGDDLAAELVETCLFRAERPVMMIPKGCHAPDIGGHVLMAWNDGAEALSAARAALPLIQQAEQADICIIDPPEHGADRSDPGGAMAQYLKRHGATPEVAVIAKTEPRVGDVLLRRAREVGAGLIVAGAYGHSRLREAMFGGATRSLLEMADRPILMSR